MVIAGSSFTGNLARLKLLDFLHGALCSGALLKLADVEK